MSAAPPVNRRRRFLKVVLLFTRLMTSFLWSYGRARLTGTPYDFYLDHEKNRKRARWIHATAADMGGVIIKVGQFLSTRVDLLPNEYIEELALLQDEVPPVSFDEIRAVIEDDFGRPLDQVFARFEPVPLAAASLGQAHLGLLWGGQRVVVKVKSPRIAEIVEADLSSLTFVVGQLNHWRAIRRRVDLVGIMTEFTATLREELDYIAEAHHAERIGIAFAKNDRIRVPRIYWSHVRPSVVTLEYTPGIKITDYDRLDDAAISRAQLAELLLQTYLQMILTDGFFHADPHPGNVFAAPGPTLILVDFGMVGRITPRMRDAIRVLFVGIVRRDFDAIVRALVQLNFVRSSADMIVVRRTVAWTVNTFYSLSFGELRDMDPRDVLEQTQEVFRAEAFQVPTNFAFLGRALGTLIGLCTGLDPSFQFMTTAEPYARELIASEGRTAGLRRLTAEMRNIALTTSTLPLLAQSTLQGVGDLQWLQRDLTDITNLVVFLDKTLKALIYGLLSVGFLIAGAFLIQRYRLMSVIFLVIAAVFILRLLGTLVRSRRASRR